MKLEDSLSEFEVIAQAFNDLKISYLLGGSVASSAYGIPRGTQDIDVEVEMSVEQVQQLADILDATHMVPIEAMVEAIKSGGSFNLIAYDTAMKIDVFIRKTRSYDQQAGQRKVFGIQIGDYTAPYWVNSVEDVILRKLEWYRLGNEVAEQKWKDVIGVLKAQKTEIDSNYLSHWAIELGISDLLERAFEESGLNSSLDSEK